VKIRIKQTAMSAKYREDIDGLRAIAILMVLLFHAFPFRFRGGFIGVDVFFVISGFLIGSAVKHELDAQRISLTHFFYRRIRRIYPALLLVLATVMVTDLIGKLLFEHIAKGPGARP
jgi:peptidoglycan/LPS O-acetylase OafA/YrhL